MADSLNTQILPETQTLPNIEKAGCRLTRAEKFLRVSLMATQNVNTPQVVEWEALAPVISEALDAIFDAKCALGLEERGED